ncbi:MAG: YHYH protein [Bacteroidia bacterium]|nr:YHYH protein [Bacteroidia bacterium]
MRYTRLLAYCILGISILVVACSSITDYQRKQRRIINNENGRLDKINSDTYNINLDPESCQINIEEQLNKSSQYHEEVDEKNKLRKIAINSIANHDVGKFPNQGNPNTIQESNIAVSLPLNPSIANSKTSSQGFDSGILFSGVSIDPFTAEFFIGSKGHINRNWNITTLTTTEDLGLDCNNAHVQPSGKYHYHGTPSAFLSEIGADGSQMIKVGYASDGYPIYYKYGFDENGVLKAYESGYRLKDGNRPGDGVTAPDGTYNGRYFQDYEFIPEVSDLDECNGRWGKTAENENEYYYLITDNFPSVPICFSGTPASDMAKGFMRRPPRPPHSPRSPH